ncbi:MAG TPA: hypothetical protein VKY24_06795 [Reyranella sp.]|nr:hypothetical protein [Reyranella sp.]
MSKYPLEWGWHTAQDTDSSAPTNAARETLLGRKPQQEGDVQEAALGDRLCVNHPRKNGKTGMCRDCAVKELGFENMPSNEQTDAIRPYCLQPE